MTPPKILFIILFLSIEIHSLSQNKIDSLFGKLDPQKWSASVDKRVSRLEDKIIAKSQKTLHRLQKQEEKIYLRLLSTKDSLYAKATLADIESKYKVLQAKLKEPAIAGTARQYVPTLDTLSSALNFLNHNGVTGNVNEALAKTESLQGRLQQVEEIKNFIRQRKQQLKEQLTNLGFAKQLKKFNKEAYYYAVQLKEYSEVLKDSKKAERKALGLICKTKQFKDFMRKNSMLASLFRLPGDPNDPLMQAGMAGLQTRAEVSNLIQQQIGSSGTNAQALFQQNMQSSQSQISQLKNKISQFEGGSSDDIMPEGFLPNNQKTKGFWKRIEIGTNFQTQKANNLFPVTSDIGLSLGYKLNDKSVIGVGASYKVGMGKGWNHIRITHEGAGFRSFIDWKMKGNLWITGGYELNYMTAFDNFYQLKDLNNWQQSGLLGFSKMISVRSKIFNKTKLQLLWDFLSYRQKPRTQPIVFRVGYNIK